MTNLSLHMTGMPYAPGSARGFLRNGWEGATSSDIAIISQSDIGPLLTRPAGFIVVEGAPLSHAMIGLLGSGVPTVIVSKQQALALHEGRDVWLDGGAGLITTDIATSAVTPPSAPAAGQPVLTTDGVAVYLRASVRSAAAARQALACGAETIGLVRSEFLLPEGGVFPDVKFYQCVFSELCAAAAPLPVTVRLLDLAADKMPDWVPSLDAAGGALGLQGVRLFNTEPVQTVFHAQLTALDGLRDRFDIRLLIPYLSRYEELCYWADYIRHHLSKPVPIGAMVETPAGALDVANWLDVADFVAIGCNDLMQCLFAADRDRPELRDYLAPYAPLLFRFLKQVADSAASDLHRIQLCGVLPQLSGVLPILLGLGYRAFSVDAMLIPYLVQTLQATTIADTQALALEVCAAIESRQVSDILGLKVSARGPDHHAVWA